MQTHIIEDGVVVNTILATTEEARAAYPSAVCIDGSVGGIGWLWDGTTLSAPPVPEPAPQPRTRADVLADLATLDTKSIRALCEQDTARLASLEVQKEALRTELRSLT